MALQGASSSSSSFSIPPWAYHVFLSFRGEDTRNGFTATIVLKVLGSDLFGKATRHWSDAIRKYRRISEKNIHKILRTSYDGLHDNEKKIFLDIACFFRGNQIDYINPILVSCGFSPCVGIKVLIDKSLITIRNDNIVRMHDMLQDVGKEIVCQESPEEPGKRSRIWFHEDVRHVLEENMGTNKIEGILVDMPEQDLIHLNPKVFKKMRSLRLFINRNARFAKGPNYLSNELRLLDWPEYPSESLPLNFRGEKLVAFKMQNSLFKELKEGFKNLTVMNFSKCKYLEKIPDLSNNKNLVKLTLDLCTNLVEVHHSVGFLDNLDTLSVNRCSNLWSFPKRLKLRSLKSINLEGCSSLENFPEIECEMKGLHRLDLKGTSIKELPSSIAYLTRLEIFNLPGCRNLPASILQLQHLKFIHLDDSSGLKFLKQVGDSTESIQSIIKFQSLQEASLQDGILSESNFFTTFNFSSTLENLHLSGSDIVSLPACMKGFVRLRYLWLNDCKKLEEILDLPPNILEVYAAGCMSLERFPEVSKKCELNASDSEPLHWIDLSRCNKMLVNIGNHVPNSLWEQGHLKHH